MKKQLQSENGMTLVELLAALVLLSIVLLAFFTFFTQSAKFTQHNKEKLTAVEVAEDVVADVRNGNYQESIEFIKNGYMVTITIEDLPINLMLKKAVITVESDFDSEEGIRNSTFITEMYFDEVGQ